MNRSGYRIGEGRNWLGRFSWLVPVFCGLFCCHDAMAETAVSEDKNAGPEKLPRFATNSPFGKPYRSPVPREGKRLWAASRLWQKAPELVVEKWLSPEPEREGKFLLIEFWATWCRPCRQAIPKLNDFQRRFADDLVVIGISDEDEAAVRKMVEPRIEFPLAIDTRARMKTKLSVVGIPHVIVVEPGGFVVWEGFPLLKDHELTGEMLAAIIEAGRGENSERETKQ